MDFVPIKDVSKHEGKEVALRGWVFQHRVQKDIVFIVLRDATGSVQCAIKKADGAEAYKQADSLTVESSIIVKGKVREDKRAPSGFEVSVSSFDIHHLAERFPIGKDKSPEFLLDVRHLWLRSDTINRVMRIRDAVIRAAGEWFYKNSFVNVVSPIVTPNAAEGGASVFEMDYFGEKAYLAQTAQLYLEALIFPLERVWSLTPSFRAEKSRTTRHLAEYWHLEAEIAWADQAKNMEVQEQLVAYVCNYVAEHCEEDLKGLGRDPKELAAVKTPFKKLTYDEAIKVLQKKGSKIRWGEDPGTEDERLLTTGEKQPIFVMNFPKEIKAFYMRVNDDGKTVACADLQAPDGFGELIGGSQRTEDIDYMKARLKKEGAKLKDYEWYFDLRRYGSVPHAGFGLGIERLVRWICKLEHIRDAIPFPRTINRFYP